MESMKDFLVQPESNNCITVWFRGQSVKVYHDHAALYISYDNERLEVETTETQIKIKRIQKVTIEEVSGLIDFGGRVGFDRPNPRPGARRRE